MPLQKDPDQLRIPAFMRFLTALDRKKTAMQKGLILRPKQKQRKNPLQQKFANYSKKHILQRALKKKTLKKIRNDTIGIITHYYNKIQVGVIKLSSPISVGDYIIYETDDGPFEQIIESMEIDREPVFKAGRGKEIGLKLEKMPMVGGIVRGH